MKNWIKNSTLVFVILLGVSFSINGQDLDSLVNGSLQFARQQLTNTVIEIGDTTRYARSTVSDCSWGTKSAGSWASGFFPGCLWYMYEWTSDINWKNRAQSWTAGMEGQKYDTGTHDVGFQIFCSFGNGYRLTGNAAYFDVINRAAQSLATRYNPTVGCIRSWNNRTFPVIIDNMMNLEILFWASKNGGGTALYDKAVSHAEKTMENNVRTDGSTYQIVDYNPITGAIVKKETHQGYTDESTWSRGQAWGLYGFTMTYRETGDVRFLETAKKIADYFVDNLPGDYVPYWDFDAPNIPDEKKDVSAAAIGGSGLLELSGLVTDPEKKLKYFNAAVNILASICSIDYLAQGTSSSGILLHGVGNHNGGTEVDVSLIYADYYFIEALLRYQEIIATSVAYIENNILPSTIQLFQNYPNPFNSTTAIQYYLPKSQKINLTVFNIKGQKVTTLYDGLQESGIYQVIWNGLDYRDNQVPSGIYIFSFHAEKFKQSRVMIMIK